jgi:hypothetical protein
LEAQIDAIKNRGLEKIVEFIDSLKDIIISVVREWVMTQIIKEIVLYRFGKQRESAERLAEQAAQAEKIIGIHGVSVKSKAKFPAPSAPRSEVEKHFLVHKTGKDPYHYTVELPKPVTEEVAETFNNLFRGKE